MGNLVVEVHPHGQHHMVGPGKVERYLAGFKTVNLMALIGVT